ncbi:Ig-like domain-containing protein [Clostridium felsineum]|nr:Ig-like domain-containing protein [Clostridium felsineum]
MNVGDINTLTAAVTPDNATNKTLTWTSSDPSTAFVSNTGKIKALKPGKVTITAATIDGSNLKASCEVTINKMANSITLNKDVDDLLVGETDKLISLVSPDDATVKDVIWTSSDPAVISVDNNGNITALKSGNALIKAIVQDGSGLHAQCRITVQ